MHPLRITRMGLVLVAAMLLAACGGPAATGDPQPASDPPEQVDPAAEAGDEAPGTVEREERPGRDTTLPIHPGAVRTSFFELTDTGFVVTYVADSPLDEVIAFYIDEIGSMPGVFHSEYPLGDGDYEFSLEDGGPLPDHPEQDSVFLLTLWDRGDTTEIQVMGSLDFFE